MKPVGKTIRLYLIDGDSKGPISAEVINWTGQVVAIPRSQLHELGKRDELQRTGVYLLAGPDPDSKLERVYVGEADDVLSRLRQHDADQRRDYWSRAISITSKDMNLTKAHGRYLESRIIELLKAAGKARLDNGTAPQPKTLPESDLADMEYFLEQVQLVLPLLGFDFLRPAAKRLIPDQQLTNDAAVFTLSEVGISAAAREVGDSFVVLKGSTARKEPTPSWDAYVDLRRELIEDGSIAERGDGKLEFVRDVEFRSPSAAASVVVAANRNGRLAWKLSSGETYADWKKRQATLAGIEAQPPLEATDHA